MLAQDNTSSLNVTLNASSSLLSHVAPQLPLEILQRTFLSLVEIYHGKPIRSWGHPSWINITYVCRYWRSAALDLRELWSSITPDLSIAWSRVMIERSSPLPMHIFIYISDPHWQEETRYGFNPLAASELLSTSRIRTLSISGRPVNILNVLRCLCNPSMLESLCLRLPDPGDPVEIPESLYGGDAQHLRRLTFDSGANIRVPLWLLANITHFTNNICVSLDHLLEMLAAMPQLEVLCIVRIFSYRDLADTHEDLPPPPHTKLPSLSLLSIHDRIPNSFLMLSSCIEGPPTLRRHFFWQDDYDTWSSWAWSLTILEPFVPGDSTPGANDGGLRVAQTCGHECDSFEMWSRTYSECARPSTAAREDALFRLRVEWSGRDPVDSCFPTPSLRFSHAAHIEDLTVAPETGIEGTGCSSESDVDTLIIVERWTELLTDMPSVKTLRLRRGSCAGVSVLRALSASEGSILPHLQRVIVTNFSIHSGAPARPDGMD
ncbi:hypothetical protein V8E53_001749, partial [Lactarius tabidus]